MNADVRHGIGILYLKGAERMRPTPPGEKTPLDIMFASTKQLFPSFTVPLETANSRIWLRQIRVILVKLFQSL